MMLRSAAALSIVILCLATRTQAVAATPSSLQPSVLASLEFEQHLGQSLPLDVELRDESGRPVRIRDFFGARPVILVFDYLRCPNLCGLVLSGLAQSLKSVTLVVAHDYEVLAISIDPKDSPADAAAAKARYAAINQDAARWHFLSGEASAVRQLADAAGYPYEFDSRIGQFAHPSGIVLASVSGAISRYLLGIDYKPLDLRLGLVDASKGAIAAPASRLLLLCYCYDPKTGRYSFAVTRVLQIAGLITVLSIAFPVIRMFRRG